MPLQEGKQSLAVPRVAVTGDISFLPANVGAVLRAAVPPHAFFMIDSGVQVEPYNLITPAVSLSRGFGRKLREWARNRGWRGVPMRRGRRERHHCRCNNRGSS